MSRAPMQRKRLCAKPLAAGITALLVSLASGTAGHAHSNTPAASVRESIGPDYAVRSRPSSVRATKLPQRVGSTLPVTSCADDNTSGTFRSVVASALDGDTVDLSQLTCGTITLALGAVTTDVDNLAIQGPGQTELTIDGAHADRVVVLSGAGTLAISDLSIANGYLAGDYNGGCVRSYGNISLTRTTVSGCEIAAVGYAAGGGAAARADMTLIDSTVKENTVSSSSNYYGYLFGGGVNAVGAMVISNSTISGNTLQFLGDITPYSIGYGGGVSGHYDVTITGSTIDGNQGASYGGGLFVVGNPNEFSRVEIVSSTISGNSASIGGGGVSVGGLFRTYLSSFVLHASTVAANVSQGGGGGLRFRDYTLADVQSSIIASNVAVENADIDAVETLAIYGADNLIDEADPDIALPADTLHGDPQLLPLADNGGLTRTHALAPDSPAIDVGNDYFGLDYDQRGVGFARVSGTRADIGAYESGSGSIDLIFENGFD
jgi:hypothetical protein